MTERQYIKDVINSATHYIDPDNSQYQSWILSGPDGLIQIWSDGVVSTASEFIKANPALTPTNTENIDAIKADAIMWFYRQFDN